MTTLSQALFLTMASQMLSRLLPPNVGEPSIYETLQEQDRESDQSDIEERGSMALDEENLGSGFHDYELNDALVSAAASETAPSGTRTSSRQSRGLPFKDVRQQARPNLDELDDEVPQSLLIEGTRGTNPVPAARQTQGLPPPVPGPASRGTQARWQSTQEQQRLHYEPTPNSTTSGAKYHRGRAIGMMDSKERAMWMWANVENLDNFLQDVYDYFVGNGIWCIFLNRLLNLLYA